MSLQVLQSETLTVPSFPTELLQEFQADSTKKFTSMPSTVFPEVLQEAVKRVDRCFPQMFEILPSILDSQSIRIQVQVDLTIVKKKFVRASDLFAKNIAIPGLEPNAKGLFCVDDLSERGIVVQADNGFKAHWDFQNCALTLRHSYYSRYSETDQIHSQVASMMFELQNAQFSPEFQKIWEEGAQVSKEKFVRSLEEIEFTTSRLTFFRLDRMAKKHAFKDIFNTCRYMYESFPLYYLHQQALNHSYQYAKAHDIRFKTEVSCPYQGTWKVPFPKPSEDGTLSHEQQILARILSDHLEAIYEPDERYRAQKEREMYLAIAEVKATAAKGYQWCQNIWENLQFFQEEYNKYVSEAMPARVVHLIENQASVEEESL
jgi:hypothetical protein